MLLGFYPVLKRTELWVMDDFVLRHNRERTAIREIAPGIQGQELWIACKGIISCEANTVRCGNIDRHKANWMIGNETGCLFSQRIANNLVIDDRFPDLQFPNANNFFPPTSKLSFFFVL